MERWVETAVAQKEKLAHGRDSGTRAVARAVARFVSVSRLSDMSVRPPERAFAMEYLRIVTLLHGDERTVDDETVALDHPTDRPDDPDEVGDDDDDAGREGRADVVAVVGIVDEVHDGAVEHLVIDDDGDDTDDARWNGCDGWEVWVTGDGDGE